MDTIGIQPSIVHTLTSSFASMVQKSKQNPGYQTLKRFYPDEQVREGARTHGPRWAAAGGRGPRYFLSASAFSPVNFGASQRQQGSTNELDTWLALH